MKTATCLIKYRLFSDTVPLKIYNSIIYEQFNNICIIYCLYTILVVFITMQCYCLFEYEIRLNLKKKTPGARTLPNLTGNLKILVGSKSLFKSCLISFFLFFHSQSYIILFSRSKVTYMYFDKISVSIQEKDILKYGGRIVGKSMQTILNATKNVLESRKSLTNAKIVLWRH